MPPIDEPQERSLQEVVEDLGVYPEDAYYFVQRGLSYAIELVHGEHSGDLSKGRHISGQQLCEGLRRFALQQWGMMARTVLRRWNINSTLDFGRIVFAMIEAGFMQRTEHDELEDFRGVFDFRSAFEADYRIEIPA